MLLLFSGLAATATAASQNTTSPTSAASVQPDKPVERHTGTTVYGWVSKNYLAAHPHYLRTQAAKVGSTAAPSAVTPQSAFTCDGPVCIDVQGSGLKVNQWNTTATGNVGCSEASYIRNGSTVFVSDSICPSGSGSGVYYYYTNPNTTYPNNTKLCNVWEWFVGYPCATVHR
ncbi:hypothetical protein ACWCRD_13140 [Streptomyces sp. NPDC002092]